MANHNEDLRFVRPITTERRSAGVVSGVIDCEFGGFNYGACLLICDKNAFATKSSKMVLRARHTTASNTTYANSTAFNTAIVVSGATNSTTEALAVNIARSGGTGRFIRVLLSGVTASTNCGVIAQLSRGSRVPPSSSGFASVTYSPPGP